MRVQTQTGRMQARQSGLAVEGSTEEYLVRTVLQYRRLHPIGGGVVDFPGKEGNSSLIVLSSGVRGGEGDSVSLVPFVELALDGVRAWSDEEGAEGCEENDRFA